MKRIAIVLVFIALLLGCNKSPKPTPTSTIYYLGDTFTIKYATWAEVWDTINPNNIIKMRIKFDSIYDDRCPAGYPICAMVDYPYATMWFRVIKNNQDTLIQEGRIPDFSDFANRDTILYRGCPVNFPNALSPDLGDYWLCIMRLTPYLDSTNTDGIHYPPKGILFPKSEYKVLVKITKK